MTDTTDDAASSRPGVPSPVPGLPDLGRRTLVMGILNVTPDSFSDGGLFAARSPALDHAARLIAESADILDIGGESTRPGSTPVSGEEERARVIPLLREIAATSPIPISIDTYRASTAGAAFEAGATILNDVWGLQREPEIARVAAAFGAPAVIMHNRDAADPSLDILDELRRFFDRSLAIARTAGIPDSHVILDPGIGFGKTFAQNLVILARLGEIRALGFPILIGTSRKMFLGRILDRPQPRDRGMGTLASNVLAIAAGADILRVHDVAAHVDACKVADAILAERQSGEQLR